VQACTKKITSDVSVEEVVTSVPLKNPGEKVSDTQVEVKNVKPEAKAQVPASPDQPKVAVQTKQTVKSNRTSKTASKPKPPTKQTPKTQFKVNQQSTSQPIESTQCTFDKEQKSKTIIGELEYVTLIPSSRVLKARIDTGATTTSVDAKNILHFVRDGEKWVSFDILDMGETYTFKLAVKRRVKIKRHGAESQRRYVVEMTMQLGVICQNIEVTLSDRSEYNFPLLIGRNFLQDNFIVDVSLQYTQMDDARTQDDQDTQSQGEAP
jgi:hypothetical protein